jgi:4-amino-4-deoxy-L-arabinose transferase-like glycosyltransferase
MKRTNRTEIAFLAALVASACVVQVAVIQRAAVPALDAVRFVHSARLLGEAGFGEWVRSAPDAPLFAVWVAAVHAMVAGLVGDFRQAWALSAQIASAVPLVLLPIPVYGLSRCLAGARPARYGTALVVFLPELVRLGGDGISDSTHLFFLSVAMWLLAAVSTARRTKSPASPAVAALAATAGVSTGLAALVRAEAAVLALASAIVLPAGRFHRGVCRRQRLAALFAYGLGLAATGGLYAPLARPTLTDRLPASSAGRLVNPVLPSAAASATAPEISLAGGQDLCFAPKDPTISIRQRGWAGAPVQVLARLAKAMAYAPGLLAIAGLLSLRRRPGSAADRLLQVFTVLLLGGVFVHTAREGYLSARHLLPVCAAAAACVGHGVEVAARAVRRGVSRLRSCGVAGFPRSRLGTPPFAPANVWEGSQAGAWEPEDSRVRKLGLGNAAHSQPHPFASCLAGAIVLAVLATCLVDGTRPAHRTRLGHRLAAGWLARHAAAGQSVVDTQGLTGLYSGLPTIPYAASRTELGRDGLRYFVVEDQELRRPSKRGQTLRLLLATAGQHAASFPAADERDHRVAGVSVYRWDASRVRASAAPERACAPPEIRLAIRTGSAAGSSAAAAAVDSSRPHSGGSSARN